MSLLVPLFCETCFFHSIDTFFFFFIEHLSAAATNTMKYTVINKYCCLDVLAYCSNTSKPQMVVRAVLFLLELLKQFILKLEALYFLKRFYLSYS